MVEDAQAGYLAARLPLAKTIGRWLGMVQCGVHHVRMMHLWWHHRQWLKQVCIFIGSTQELSSVTAVGHANKHPSKLLCSAHTVTLRQL